jgi:predicted nucleic acid-binding protein
MAYLIDTSILSELRKVSCDAKVTDWMMSIDPEQAFVSVLTIGEIRMGIEARRKNSPRAVAPLERWLLELETNYSDRILTITADVADRWGRISPGRPIPMAAGLIAATAIAHKLVIVTDNPTAFQGSGAKTFDPFA